MRQSAQRLLAAVALLPADATPVWFMRQAGRSLPDYRALRQRLSLLEMVKDPAVCSQVTCMPVDLLGVDAAVLFADIMLPLEGMGVEFQILEGVGPVIPDPIRTAKQVDALRSIPAEEATPYLLAAIAESRRQLGDRAALIGFGPAPFTLACYLVEGRGSRDYPHVRALMHAEPELWARLMRKLTEVLTEYLLAQASAGAQLVQVFDSWAGVLDAGSYRLQVVPHLRRMFDALAGTVPAIYFSTGSTHLLDDIRDLPAPGVSVDWRLPLGDAWRRIGYKHCIQGNLDPALLLASAAALDAGTRAVLTQAGGRSGHIFNLGHGVLPDTDWGRLRELAAQVHQLTSRDPAAPGGRGPG
ncbi:MAG: uroporphyrinogen decarboxylase [Candidatus Dormibacteria bacterium]